MSFNIQGKNNISYDLNSWAYRPLLALCQLVIDKDSLDINTADWDFNDGKGLRSVKKCNALADSLEDYLGLDNATLFAIGEDLRTPYKVERQSVIEFIRFLRHCGGFKIW